MRFKRSAVGTELPHLNNQEGFTLAAGLTVEDGVFCDVGDDVGEVLSYRTVDSPFLHHVSPR